MIEKLNRWLFSTVYKSEEDQRMARVLFILICAYWFASLVVIVLDQVWGNKSLTINLIAGGVFQLIPVLLLRYGKLAASGFFNIAIYLVFATYFATIGQGIHDYVVILYPIIIMIAGLTGHRRRLILATIISLAAIAWLILGEINGWISPIIVPSRWPDIIAAGLLILTGAIAVYLLVTNLEYGMAQTRHELNERKRVETALRESEENLKEIIESSPDNIFVVEIEGNERYRLKRINTALEKIFNSSRSNIEGKYISDLVDKESAKLIHARFAQCIRTKTALKYEEYATLPNKTYFTSLIPILNKEETVVRLIGISRDITERKQAEDALRSREGRYRALFEQSHDGVFIISLDGQYLDVNQRGAEMLGYSVDEILYYRGREILAENGPSQRTIKQLMTGKKVPLTERMFCRKDGTVFTAEVNMELVLDGNGNPLHIQSIVRDITIRKKMQLAMEQTENRFRALIEHSTDAITLIDANARVVYESPSVALLSGYTAEERLGRSGLELIYPEDIPMIRQILGQVLSEPNRIESARFRSVHKDGNVRWTEGTAINLLHQPSVKAIVINYRDITDRNRAETALREANEQLSLRIKEVIDLQHELREQALRDPLTGLYNRRHLADAMEREVARIKREKLSLSVIVIDIDYFKKINDNHGHQIGDQFLIAISKVIASHARTSDIACRYGGEEFLLVMPGANMRTAIKRAEEIRKECADIKIVSGEKNLKVTLSLGVATYPKHGKTAEEIVIKADKAMYKAKRAGRNCVTAWK